MNYTDAEQQAIQDRVEYTETVLGRRTGTISEATMRPEDLIPAFLSELEAIAAVGSSVGLEAQEYLQRIRRDYALDLMRLEEGRELIVTDRDMRMVPELVSDLFDALDALSPAGFYFGAHIGNGSDYGYWPVEFLED